MKFINVGQWLAGALFVYAYFILNNPLLYLSFMLLLSMFFIAAVIVSETKKHMIAAVASTVHLMEIQDMIIEDNLNE